MRAAHQGSPREKRHCPRPARVSPASVSLVCIVQPRATGLRLLPFPPVLVRASARQIQCTSELVLLRARVPLPCPPPLRCTTLQQHPPRRLNAGRSETGEAARWWAAQKWVDGACGTCGVWYSGRQARGAAGRPLAAARLPESRRKFPSGLGWAGLGWAGLGWAGLGWALGLPPTQWSPYCLQADDPLHGAHRDHRCLPCERAELPAAPPQH
eukprot:gene13269-biopygen9552